jgi:hypothetical protein
LLVGLQRRRDEEALRRARRERSTSDVGVLTCVQKVHAGDYERHVVTALDADTRCKVVVNAAPKQYDLEQTKACARAVVEALDADGLRL